jgi:predicted oxidoreductase
MCPALPFHSSPATHRSSLAQLASKHLKGKNTKMQTISFGHTPLKTSRLAYGCWRVAGSWEQGKVTAESRKAGRHAIAAAYDAGYTLFDTANIYCGGETEEILSAALREISGMRDKVVIVTKCGVRFAGDSDPKAPSRYDFSAAHIRQSCESSLRRLGIEAIDVYLLHRPDFLCDPAEVAGAFSKLHAAGKVRHFGISNFRPTLVSALKAACPMPLITHQIEVSLANLTALTDGILDQCLQDKMTPMAWSPLAAGLIGAGASRLLPAQENYKPARFLPTLEEIANQRSVSRTVIALSWLLKHPSRIVPVIGTTKPERIRELATAPDTELSREEWYRLLIAARGERLP